MIPIQGMICFFLVGFTPLCATTYYVSIHGNDSNQGSEITKAWRTLSRASEQKYDAGDRISLVGPHVYSGGLRLMGIQGTAKSPIVVSSLSSDALATIDARGFRDGVYLENCSHVKVHDLKITGDGRPPIQSTKGKVMRCGVKVVVSESEDYESIILERLNIHHIFYNDLGLKRGSDEVRTANGTQSYGWGIRLINSSPKSSMGTLRHIVIKDCSIVDVAHTGIKFTTRGGGFLDVAVHGNRVLQTGGPGIQLSGVHDGHFHHNIVDRSGSNDDSRKWGRGSGLWTWDVNRILIEHNRFTRAHGPGDSAGAHIDFNSNDVIMQYNFSALNAGGFCEILGNNFRCSYRYNISVNDGHRIKGQNDAFQNGKILWLSGYTGRGSKKHGPYHSYIYNNTIYVSEDHIPFPKVSFFPKARGILITNNIFHISTRIGLVEGDQSQHINKQGLMGREFPDGHHLASKMAPVIFKNNLFLRADVWPTSSILKDTAPLVGDPMFLSGGGLEVSDYMPQVKELIRDRGLRVEALDGEGSELYLGMKVEKDILGAPIRGLPDLGAIEVP